MRPNSSFKCSRRFQVHIKNASNRNRPRIRRFKINNDVSRVDLECLNQVLREHKIQHCEGKGFWKVVPKDSCEVYKQRYRRKKQKERQGRNPGEGNSNRRDEDVEKRKSDTTKYEQKSKKKRPHKEPNSRRRKRQQRPKLSSSYLSERRCYSTSSFSDMDY